MLRYIVTIDGCPVNSLTYHNKLTMILCLREALGIGLKDAKDLIEAAALVKLNITADEFAKLCVAFSAYYIAMSTIESIVPVTAPAVHYTSK